MFCAYMKNTSRFRIHNTGSKTLFSNLLRSLAMVSIVVVAVAAPVAPASAAASNQSTWHRGGIAKMRMAHAVTTLGPVSIPVSQNQIGWLALSNIGAVEPFNIRTGQLLDSPIYLPTGLVPVSIAYWQPNPTTSTNPTEDPMVLVLSNNSSTGADSLTFIDAAKKIVIKTISLGGINATSVAASIETDTAVITDTNGAGATTTWGYNTLGQLICQSYDNVAVNTCRGSGAGTSSPPTGLLTFSYDALGRASSLITWTGVTLTSAYDCAGSKAWVSTGTTSVLSCDESHLATPAIPTSSAAITTTYSQNSTGQFTNQATTTNAGATNLLSFSFSYDDLSRLISSTPTVNSLTKTTDSYAYDPSSRVTSGPITGTTGNPNYSYSPTGAITQATTHFASAAYSQNGQLCWTNPTAVGSPSCASTPSTATTFTYDLNGNRTGTSSATGSTSLSWQSTSGRLICVNTAGTSCSTTSPSATTTLYSYDGDGHRMTSSNNGTTNAFIWDTGASQLLADSTHDYVYLQGSVTPDLQINLTTGTVDLLIQDQNANTRGVVQVTGANSSLNNTLVNYTDYDAYGNAITQSGGSINPGGMSNGGVSTDISTSFAFGAGYWDSSNLTYLVHRYLDNETGQFISVDPLVDQTRVAYVYAGDAPVMAIDAMGLDTEGLCLTGTMSLLVFQGLKSACIERVVGKSAVWRTSTASDATLFRGEYAKKVSIFGATVLNRGIASVIKSIHGMGASATIAYDRTSCPQIACLKGKFLNMGASGAVFGLAVTAGAVQGSFQNRKVYGAYAGVGLGTTGVEFTFGPTNTKVWQLSQSESKDANRIIDEFKAFEPVLVATVTLEKWLVEPW